MYKHRDNDFTQRCDFDSDSLVWSHRSDFTTKRMTQVNIKPLLGSSLFYKTSALTNCKT